MDQARPSRAALRVAMRRAAHQLYDAPPLVFNDPFAVRILGPHAAELDRTPGRNPKHKARPSSVGLRAFLVARSRYAEDLLAQAVPRGVTQYVLLGAGLDTFAHRNPYPLLHVFEVDRPATQQWKRELLRTIDLGAPPNLAYVPVDFEQQTLGSQLHAAGLDPRAPTFFSWLGVVPYLTLNAFRETLRFVASQPRGSGIVFDYCQPRAVLSPHEQQSRDSLASRVHLAGEAFHLFFTPVEIAAELTIFRNIEEDIGAAEINARYFANRTDSLELSGTASRLISAWL